MKKNTKQHRLADKYHTCTCPDREMAIQWGTTRIVDVDFENSDQPKDEGRTLWVVSKCGNCKGDILHGTSFTDYRTTGEALLSDAIDKAQKWILGNCEALRFMVASLDKQVKFEKALQRIWAKYQKEAKKGNVCHGCGADLLQPGSVARTYLVKGQYDKNGYFNNTGSMDSTDDPDICTNCGDSIMSTNYPELEKALAPEKV